MYKIKHLPRAISQILEIENRLNEYSPTAADRFAEAIDERIAALAKMPLMHPAYEKDPFFRKMVLGDYILFYSVDEKRKLIIVHLVFHHSRDIDRHMRKYQM